MGEDLWSESNQNFPPKTADYNFYCGYLICWEQYGDLLGKQQLCL